MDFGNLTIKGFNETMKNMTFSADGFTGLVSESCYNEVSRHVVKYVEFFKTQFYLRWFFIALAYVVFGMIIQKVYFKLEAKEDPHPYAYKVFRGLHDNWYLLGFLGLSLIVVVAGIQERFF